MTHHDTLIERFAVAQSVLPLVAILRGIRPQEGYELNATIAYVQWSH